jgi:hypothetical protein
MSIGARDRRMPNTFWTPINSSRWPGVEHSTMLLQVDLE